MNDPFAEVLGYRDRLPLAITPLPVAPDELQLAQWQDHDLRVLAAAVLIEERHRRGESTEPLESEIERLHQKVDLMLELLGAVLRQQRALPPACALRLSREGLSWQPASPQPWEVGTTVLLEIHLHPGLPAPLLWPATLVAVDVPLVAARLSSLGNACDAALERHVFTRHRRSVAEARSPVVRGELTSAR